MDQAAPPTKACPFCGEDVKIDAKKCKHCGETIDVTLRMAEDLRRDVAANRQGGGGPNIVVTASGGGGGGASSSSSSSAAATAAAPAAGTVAAVVVSGKPAGSLFILAFWMFMFFPVGIVYYLMRSWPWQARTIA
jgi:hypothetical protein